METPESPSLRASAEWNSAIQQTGSLRYEATRFTTADGLADDRVFAFHEDADGVLWIGTHNGLSRFKDGRFFTFRTEQGLLDNLINHLLEDDFGRLWFSCNRGIFRIARAELDAVADGKQPRARAVVYGTADGMLSPETNGEHQPAGCKARDGRLWFPTAQGVVVIDPRSVNDSDLPAPVVVEEVIVDGETVWRDGAARSIRKSEIGNPKFNLPPGRARVLQFRYTANAFADPRRVRFRYRLAGLDKVWRAETDERVAYYTSLRPGDYRFEVQAANHHGVWNETPATLAFALAPYYWQTWPFYGLCALTTIGVVAGLTAHRLRVLRRILRLDHERALEQERARIARDLHDDLGASLTGVALQLEAAQRRGQAEGQQLAALAGETRSLAHELRELAWTTNPRCDNAGSLVSFIGEQTERFCHAAELECRLSLPGAEGARIVPARVRHELLVVLKESFANIASHAGARSVAVTLTVSEDQARLVIQDDGRGFDPARMTGGSGLRNLRERLQQLDGIFTVECQPGCGTTVTAALRLNQSNYT